MTEYLLKSEHQFRVDTVAEALKLRDKFQQMKEGELMSFSYVTKYIKEKGIIVDEYQVVKIKLAFTSEKEPEERYFVKYSEEDND